MKTGKTIGVVCTVLGGAVGLWVIARLSSVLGQQQTWAPPFEAYETATLAGAGVAVLLLIAGLTRWTAPADLDGEAELDEVNSKAPIDT